MALTTRLPSMKVEPFYGFVESTGDALRLIQAARSGIIPRITRRLNDLERRAMIRSGSIFIFSDEESGIKRWTEGLSWSASRIVGNFLVYREVTERVGARAFNSDKRSSCRPRKNSVDAATAVEQRISKSLVGCLNDTSGRFKVNGLVKKTITVCVEGSDHHLIAYYRQEDVRLGKLSPLSSRNDIMSLEIPPELLESTKFRVPPVTQEGLDGRPRYICDADEGDLTQHNAIPLPTVSTNANGASPTVLPRLSISTYALENAAQSPTTSVQNGLCNIPITPTWSSGPSSSPSGLDGSFDWLSPPNGGGYSRSSSVSSGSESTSHYDPSPTAQTSDGFFLSPYSFTQSSRPDALFPFDSSPLSSTRASPQPGAAVGELPDLNFWGAVPTYELGHSLFIPQPNTSPATQGALSSPADTGQDVPSSIVSLSMPPSRSPACKELLDTTPMPLRNNLDYCDFAFMPFVQQPLPEIVGDGYFQLFDGNRHHQSTWTQGLLS